MSFGSKRRFRFLLRELGYTSYGAYLRSDHWLELRRRHRASKLYHGCCDGCLSTARRLNLHHRTYKRLGREWLMDLVWLCDSCHQAAHRLDQANPKRGLWSNTKKSIRRARRAAGHSGPLRRGPRARSPISSV